MSNGGRLKTFIFNFVITTKINPDRLSPIRAIATLLPTEKPPEEDYFQVEKIVQTRHNKKKEAKRISC